MLQCNLAISAIYRQIEEAKKVKVEDEIATFEESIYIVDLIANQK